MNSSLALLENPAKSIQMKNEESLSFRLVVKVEGSQVFHVNRPNEKNRFEVCLCGGGGGMQIAM